MNNNTAKPGRPIKGSAAMTTAQRATEFRRNRIEQAGQAHEHLDSATEAVLLAGLARQLKYIKTAAGHADAARDIAADIIRELCSRNGIKLA